MKVRSLTDLNLHDTCINSLNICPNDNVIIFMDYIEDYASCNTVNKKLVFSGCFRVKLNFYFSLVESETIFKGYEIEDSKLISEIYELWEKNQFRPQFELTHYCIETSSSGWKIDIVAKKLELLDYDPTETDKLKTL